jgi:hypothetical protein
MYPLFFLSFPLLLRRAMVAGSVKDSAYARPQRRRRQRAQAKALRPATRDIALPDGSFAGRI